MGPLQDNFTLPHEGSLAVVHDVLRNQSVVHHTVLLHAAEAAVTEAAFQLLVH